jgi:hypothetical protein
MNAHRERAVVLLVNYFEAIARKAGMPWDADYTVEIGEAVDEIVAAAVQEVVHNEHVGLNDRLVEIVRRLDKHERRLNDGGVYAD